MPGPPIALLRIYINTYMFAHIFILNAAWLLWACNFKTLIHVWTVLSPIGLYVCARGCLVKE